jgi:hypothetical protein
MFESSSGLCCCDITCETFVVVCILSLIVEAVWENIRNG